MSFRFFTSFIYSILKIENKCSNIFTWILGRLNKLRNITKKKMVVTWGKLLIKSLKLMKKLNIFEILPKKASKIRLVHAWQPSSVYVFVFHLSFCWYCLHVSWLSTLCLLSLFLDVLSIVSWTSFSLPSSYGSFCAIDLHCLSPNHEKKTNRKI